MVRPSAKFKPLPDRELKGQPVARSGRETAIWAVAILIHVLFWVSLRTHWLVPLFNDTVHRFGPGADFFALYQAGHSALHGQSIYRFVPGHTVIPYAYPFRYLPASAYSVGILLTLVPPAVAYALWLGLCELCLVRNVRLTYSLAGGGERGAWLAAVWLAFAPYFLELWVGQFTFLLGCLLFWSVLALERGRERAALGWWTASVLWKPASLLWVPLWLRERRFWAGLAVCAGLLAANLVYFRFFPADWRVFADTNLHPLPTWHAGNVGLSGLIYQFTGKRAFVAVRLAITALLVGPALWATFRPREGGRMKAVGGTAEERGIGNRLAGRPSAKRPPDAVERSARATEENGFAGGDWVLPALWTSLYFLVYKDVWEHHLTMLMPFLVLALWRSPSRLLIGVTVLLALPSPFVLYDLPRLGFMSDPQTHFSWPVSLLHHAWRVAPLVVLYVHWLRQAIRGESSLPAREAAPVRGQVAHTGA